jgi:hypothetical protein
MSATVIGAAQAQEASLCPAGSAAAVVRVSQIKPTGSMDGFKKAYADHVKWYADHNLSDKFALEPVLIYDPAKGSATTAPDQLMTVHYRASTPPPHAGDAAWDAYVAEYRANSDITTEILTCLPN